MAREPQAFGPMFLSMIKVAEARGGVPETLKMLAQHYEARQRLLRTARSAMIYPVIVITVASLVVALISIFLLPKFAETLERHRRQQEFAAPQRGADGLQRVSCSTSAGGSFPLAMISTPFLLIYFYKTAAGKAIMDRMVLATPVFGSLCRKLDTTRFARTLSVLLNAGVDIGNSIDMTADVLVMTPIRRAVRSARPKIIGRRRIERNPRRHAAVHARCDLGHRLGRRDRQAAGEPRPPGGRLRRASRDHGREPGAPGPAAR